MFFRVDDVVDSLGNEIDRTNNNTTRHGMPVVLVPKLPGTVG